MNSKMIVNVALFLLAGVLFAGCSTHGGSRADDRRERNQEARAALEDLYSKTPGARALGEKARGILIFPNIVKGGLIVGGQFGEGVLFRGDLVSGYYSSVAGSYGLQAGLQKFGYALFFMTEADLMYLNRSEGWEIGVGPSITILDEGMANSFTTTTARSGVFAFFFEQKGLMAGIGIQGTKISRIDR